MVKWDAAALALSLVALLFDGHAWSTYSWVIHGIVVVGAVFAVAMAINARLVVRHLGQADEEPPPELAGADHPYREAPKKPLAALMLFNIGRVEVAALAAAVAVGGFGWWASMDRGDWVTGARAAAWFDGNGQRIENSLESDGGPRWLGCRAIDIGLEWVRVGDSLWRVCGESKAFGGERSLGRLNVRQMRGEARWPFPAALPHQHTEAILPHGDRVAIAYTTNRHMAQLALGVAGPDGWIVAPAGLGGGELLGLAWVGDDLHAAMDRGGRVEIVAGEDTRTLPVAEICGEQRCSVEAAWLQDGDWCWLYKDDDYRTYKRCGEGEAEHVPGIAKAFDHFLVEPSGKLHYSATWRVDGDGNVAELPYAGPAQTYELADGEMRLVMGVERDGVTVSNGQLGDDETVEIVADSKLMRVARSGIFCSFEAPALFARDGGHWLVDAHGCYVALTPDFQRADPLGLFEHLSRRGSAFMTTARRAYALDMLFVRFGLPLTFATGLLLAWRVRDRKRYPIVDRHIAVTAGAFVVVAAMALHRLLPLMG